MQKFFIYLSFPVNPAKTIPEFLVLDTYLKYREMESGVNTLTVLPDVLYAVDIIISFPPVQFENILFEKFEDDDENLWYRYISDITRIM